MLRLTPPQHQRYLQADSFNATFGGAESNVAGALENFDINTEFVSRLPENDIGVACLNRLHQYGVGTNHILWGGDRLGIYYFELGKIHRRSNVIYDRANSSFSTLKPNMLDWEDIFSDADWFHWTGITPALSESVAKTCQEAVEKAQENDVTVSCDLNYRGKLWNWGKAPDEVMSDLVEHVDVCLGNEEDAQMIFGIEPPEVDVESGELDPEDYLPVAEELMDRFPNIDIVGTTLRESISASHNKWSAVVYNGDEMYHSPIYDLTHIVDRLGGGDSFAGGLISRLLNGEDLQDSLEFAVAFSALAHTIYGDFPLVKEKEAEDLMKGSGSGRVSR